MDQKEKESQHKNLHLGPLKPIWDAHVDHQPTEFHVVLFSNLRARDSKVHPFVY